MSSPSSFAAAAPAPRQVANPRDQFRRVVELAIILFCAPFKLAFSPILIPYIFLDSIMREVVPEAFHRKTYNILKILFHFLPALILLHPINACKMNPFLKEYAIYRFAFFIPYKKIVQAMEIWKYIIGLQYRGFNALTAAEKPGLVPDLAVWWRILYALSVGPLVVGFHLELLFSCLDPFADWIMYPYKTYIWQPRLDRDIAERRRRLDVERREQIAALRAME